MNEPPTGWVGETRAEGSANEREPTHPATRADASAARTGRPLSALQTLARDFEILGELGRGGMGVVYRARDPKAGREVAIKLLLATPSPVRLRRFEREGATAARLRHRGIVAVHSAGQVGGRPYLVCELVEGARTFDEASQDLPLEARLRLLREVIDAVAYAHGEGVIHRDLKPANVIVDSEGTPRVTDFGLARHEGDDRLTRTGASLGTPTHMAPEQARGERDKVGPPADVWSLGIMLHEVVCGSPPFADDSATPLEAFLRLQQERPPTLRARGAEVSSALDALAKRSLARNPEERFPDARALCEAFDAALAEGPMGRRSAPLGLLLLLVVATAGSYLVLSLVGAEDSSPAHPSPTPPLEVGVSSSAGPSPSLLPSPSVPVADLLASLEAKPDPFRRAEAAWDWLSATPRAQGSAQVRAALRQIDRPVRTRELPGAARLLWLLGGRLLVATRDGEGFIWDPGSDTTEDLPGFKSGCTAISPAPDRRTYAVLGNLGIDAWIYPGAQRVKLPLKVGAVSLAPSGELVAGQRDGQVVIFNPLTGIRRGSFQAHSTRIYFLQALSGGRLLTASRHRREAGQSDSLKLWSREQRVLWDAPIPRRVDSLSLDRAERLCLVKFQGGLLARFDLPKREGPHYYSGGSHLDAFLANVPLAHAGEVIGAVIDPSGSYAYSTAWLSGRLRTTQLRIWDARSGTLLETREGEGRYGECDISPDGRWFAAINIVSKVKRRIEVWPGLPPR